MESGTLNAADLVRDSLATLSGWTVAGFLGEAVRGLREAQRRVLRSPAVLSSCTSGRRACPEPLQGPDCVWQKILVQRPKLACYPLGEVVERAVKKAFAEVLARAGLTPGSSRAARISTWGSALAAVFASDADLLARRFLVWFLFEIAIERLRRGEPGARDDSAYRYHFSADGRFLPAAAERRFRRDLADQCGVLASDLLPGLLGALGRADFDRTRRRLESELQRVCGLTPDTASSGPMEPCRKVFVAGDLPATAVSEARGDASLILTIGSPRSNLTVSCQHLERLPAPGGCRPLHPLVLDLLEIGAAIYMAGLHVPHPHHYGRRIEMTVAARYPEVWQKVGDRIEKVVTLLARDDFTFRFTGRGASRQEPVRFAVEPISRPICLFSGGLDSLAGAISILEEGAEKPLFVSHYSNSSLAALQKVLIHELAGIYGRDRFDHLQFPVARARRKNPDFPLPSSCKGPFVRFLRPFLIQSLACATALHAGSTRVLVFESGPMALNPLANEAEAATHSADPRFLHGFQTLVRAVFGVPLAIENPFLYRTKGEILRYLAGERVRGLVARSSSCWRSAQLWARAKKLGLDATGRTHDGDCSPCLLRRVAVHSAGLWDADAAPLVDVFGHFVDLDRETQTMIADAIRFCEAVRTTALSELLLRAPDFSVCVPGVDCAELAAMYRRHAAELRDCFARRGSAETRAALGMATVQAV